jgi:hypothetical protein
LSIFQFQAASFGGCTWTLKSYERSNPAKVALNLKLGRVTLGGHANDDRPPGILNSILKHPDLKQ